MFLSFDVLIFCLQLKTMFNIGILHPKNLKTEKT